MMEERRVIAVAISYELMIDMVKDNYSTNRGMRTIKGVPADAQFVGSFTNDLKMCGYLVFSHLSFARVPFGAEIPIMDVEHQAMYREMEHA